MLKICYLLLFLPLGYVLCSEANCKKNAYGTTGNCEEVKTCTTPPSGDVRCCVCKPGYAFDFSLKRCILENDCPKRKRRNRKPVVLNLNKNGFELNVNGEEHGIVKLLSDTKL